MTQHDVNNLYVTRKATQERCGISRAASITGTSKEKIWEALMNHGKFETELFVVTLVNPT